MKPIFILGLGEPKSGTTWFYHYLMKNPEFADPGVKEWNVWAAYFGLSNIPLFKEHSVFYRLREGLPKYEQSMKWNRNTRGDLKIMTCMEKIEGFYAEYFKLLVSETDYNIAADFSPNNKLLGHYELRYIKNTLSKYFDVKVVYLFRDPIERAWSAHIHKAYVQNRPVTEEDFIEEVDMNEYFAHSSFYDKNVENIRKVFDVKDSIIEPYEFLFNEQKIKRISRQLGIRYIKGFTGTKLNKKFVDIPLRPELKKRIYELVKDDYKDTYTWCKNNFPAAYDKWMESLT